MIGVFGRAAQGQPTPCNAAQAGHSRAAPSGVSNERACGNPHDTHSVATDVVDGDPVASAVRSVCTLTKIANATLRLRRVPAAGETTAGAPTPSADTVPEHLRRGPATRLVCSVHGAERGRNRVLAGEEQPA